MMVYDHSAGRAFAVYACQHPPELRADKLFKPTGPDGSCRLGWEVARIATLILARLRQTCRLRKTVAVTSVSEPVTV
jgi:hypothetical protein